MYISKISDKILRFLEYIFSYMRTFQGALQANLGSGTRVLVDGRIINIGGDRNAINIGKNGCIRGEILAFRHSGHVTIGDWFYIGPRSTIWSSDPKGIVIGDRVLISADVMIHDTNSHPIDPELRFIQTRSILTEGHPSKISDIKSIPIRIGNDVWIGYGATICKGVSIGDRAIIGARAIVAADVPDDGRVRIGTLHEK